MKKLAVLGVSVIMAASGCGGATSTVRDSTSGQSSTSSPPAGFEDCKAQEDQFLSTQSDSAIGGAARRESDNRLLECLRNVSTAAGRLEELTPRVPCLPSAEALDPGEFVVAFVCSQATRTVTRTTTGEEVTPGVVAAAYFAGPSPEETASGIFAPLGDVLEDWPLTVSEVDGVIFIDLEEGAADRIGSLASSQGLLLDESLSDTFALNFDGATVQITAQGSCETIWKLAQMTCPGQESN